MPRRAALCKSSILVVTPIASRCLERLGVTAPSAPTTIGTTFALTFQSRATIVVVVVVVIINITIIIILLLLLLLQGVFQIVSRVKVNYNSYFQLKD